MEVEQFGSTYRVSWAEGPVSVEFGNHHEDRWGLLSDVTIHCGQPDAMRSIGPARTNITKARDLKELADRMGRLVSDVDWEDLLTRSAAAAIERYRDGEPFVRMSSVSPRARARRYLIDKVLPDGETSMLCADGGSGKSLLALGLVLSVETMVPLTADFQPVYRAPCLYLDWETNEQEQHERRGAIAAGMRLLDLPDFHYRRMTRPLYEEIGRVQRYCQQNGIGLVVVDSAGAASGMEPEKAESAIRLMNALAMLAPATRLVVHHISKQERETKAARRTPFGSAYFQNLSRCVWSLQKVGEGGDSDDIQVGMVCTKANNMRAGRRIGVTIEFAPEDFEPEIRFRKVDVNKDAAMAEKVGTQAAQLCAVLHENGPLTPQALADMTGIPDNKVRAVLSKGEGKRFVKLPVEEGERYHRWHLLTEREGGHSWL